MTHSTGFQPNRRSFMRAVGAGAAAIGASGIATAQNGQGNEPAGYLSIIYDDGPVEDYEMFQVHQQYNAPGCVATCPGLLNSDADWLNTGQLLEMSDAGWEVMSHTIRHRALGEIPIVENIEAGDSRIYPDATLHGRFEGDPIVVFDEDGNEAEAVVAGNGEDETGSYIELREPIGTGFTAAPTTRVRYTDEFIEEILADSKAQLEQFVGEGQVTDFIYPYERDDGYVSEVIPEYYNATPSKDGVGLNPVYEPDPYDLSRRYLETDHMTEAEIEDYLDSIVEEPDWGILAGHSQYDTLPPERIDFVLQQARERNIEVLTVQNALERFGVVAAPEPALPQHRNDNNNEPSNVSAESDDSMGLLDRIVAFLRSLFG